MKIDPYKSVQSTKNPFNSNATTQTSEKKESSSVFSAPPEKKENVDNESTKKLSFKEMEAQLNKANQA